LNEYVKKAEIVHILINVAATALTTESDFGPDVIISYFRTVDKPEQVSLMQDFPGEITVPIWFHVQIDPLQNLSFQASGK